VGWRFGGKTYVLLSRRRYKGGQSQIHLVIVFGFYVLSILGMLNGEIRNRNRRNHTVDIADLYPLLLLQFTVRLGLKIIEVR